MKNIRNYAIAFVLLVLLVLAYLFNGFSGMKPSKEISLSMFSPYGKVYSKIVAASCGNTIHGSADEYSSCTATCPDGSSKTGTSQCGGACSADCGSCSNGAVNPPSCNTCGAGSTMTNGRCVCNNGASNAPSCNICGAGQVMYNNLCTCANGASDVPTCQVCPSASVMQGGQCTCNNGTTPQSNCTVCPAGQVMYNGQCKPGCDITNVCGLQSRGILENGTCTTPDGSDANNSCITTFTMNAENVGPGGFVDFFWKLAPLPKNVGAKCGFVDLTTPTPRPIPGLQNLDPTTERTRISNIQTTTRFCLVCQFYNLINNNSLGEAAVHQWIRVIKIGEQ